MPAAAPPRRAARAGRDVRARATRGARGRADRGRSTRRSRSRSRRRRPYAVDGAPLRAGERRSAPGRPRRAAGRHRRPGRRRDRRADRRGVGAAGLRPRRRLARCSSTRCCSPRSSARWGCRTSSSASTPTRDGRPRGARPCACSGCSASSTRSRRSTARSAACSCPELYLTGETDSVVLRLPEAAWPGLGGEMLGALVAAGAFAAFMSTASGLLVSLAGTVSHDFRRAATPRRGPPPAVPRRRARRDGRAGAAGARRARARHLGARRLGVRARRQHVLPAAAARHLVGAADRARRRGRAGRGAVHGDRPDLRGRRRGGGGPPAGPAPGPPAGAGGGPGARGRGGPCRRTTSADAVRPTPPCSPCTPRKASASATRSRSFAHRIGAA